MIDQDSHLAGGAKNMEFSIDRIRGLIETLQPKEKIDRTVLLPGNLERIAATASLLPKSTGPGSRLIDIGGTVYWVPVYAALLGYDHVTIIGRRGSSSLHDFKDPGQHSALTVGVMEVEVDLDTYPIETGSVQCVVCSHVLEHLAGDPMHLVAESNRILKDGGYLCVTTPNVLYHANLVKFMFGSHPFGWSIFTDSYADRHNREYTPAEVKKLLELGGFSVELLKTRSYKSNLSVTTKALGFLLSMPAVLTARVSCKLRGQEIQVLAKKVAGVSDRYPKFLYDLFGESSVKLKIRPRKPAIDSSLKQTLNAKAAPPAAG
jgi:SAM-dependent methyltransferase